MAIDNSINSVWSFLLALYEFEDSLTEQEQNILIEVGENLKTRDNIDIWQDHLLPSILDIFKQNGKFYSSYQVYQQKLQNIDISADFLPKEAEIMPLIPNKSNIIYKGFEAFNPKEERNTYDKILNNVVIVVCQSDNSAKDIKKISSLGRLKKFLLREE